MTRRILLPFIVFASCLSKLSLSNKRIKPVSVFSSEEKELHKYAAILAATEPYRLQRDIDIKSALNPFKFWIQKIKGARFNDPTCLLRLENKEVDRACLRYERKADEIVRSYGLNVLTFNNLSRKIMENSSLKQRVLLQSYYYRIAADLEYNLRPQLPTLNANLDGAEGAYELQTSTTDFDIRKPKLYRFAQTLRAIEDERLKQRKSLQEEMKLSSLPSNMCSLESLPAMSKQIQCACAEFPRAAQQIVAQYGLSPDEFDDLEAKMRTDAVFRFKVHQEVDKVEKRNRK